MTQGIACARESVTWLRRARDVVLRRDLRWIPLLLGASAFVVDLLTPRGITGGRPISSRCSRAWGWARRGCRFIWLWG